jgi:hypothetical protein
MKTLTRLFSLGAIAAGLCLVPLLADTYSISGNQPATQQQWSLSIPATLSISGSVSATFLPGHSGLAAIILQQAGGSYSQVYSLQRFGSGTITGSSSASGIAAGNYTLQETCYDATSISSPVNFNISATITW